MNSLLQITPPEPAWWENLLANPLTLFCYGLVLLVLFGWYFATAVRELLPLSFSLFAESLYEAEIVNLAVGRRGRHCIT